MGFIQRLARVIMVSSLLGSLSFAGEQVPAGAVATTTFTVDSPAFFFSPGNWVGDENRGGGKFRQTWNPYAYFRVTWQTKQGKPLAKLKFDTSSYEKSIQPPLIAYCIDGIWHSKVACAPEVVISGLQGAGTHELRVVMTNSVQKERWGSPGKSGLNVLRVTGIELDEGCTPVTAPRADKWALFVGDSITEGCGASELNAYSYLVAEGLRAIGYEYGISACGWSGLLNKGDNPPGDVPAYYFISGSKDGKGGEYNDALSRWNKIDGNNHSLLDAKGRISGYGEDGQEPALIFVNYCTNDILHKSNYSDTCASITQYTAALRKSAPEAYIVLLVPFGQYYAKELHEWYERFRQENPLDRKVGLIDLGRDEAKAISTNTVYGGLHPNDRACANFAVKILPRLLLLMNEK